MKDEVFCVKSEQMVWHKKFTNCYQFAKGRIKLLIFENWFFNGVICKTLYFCRKTENASQNDSVM